MGVQNVIVIPEALDRAWLKKALTLQRAALVRSKAREIPGSEIEVLRGKELLQLDGLMARLP